MKGREIVQDLMCDLSDPELFDRAQQMSTVLQTIDEVETARRVSAKDFKDRLEGLHGESRKLSFIVRQRQEKRPVRCSVELHTPTQGVKRVVRLDTGELVREEHMTQAELQGSLLPDEDDGEQQDNLALDDVDQAQEGEEDAGD